MERKEIEELAKAAYPQNPDEAFFHFSDENVWVDGFVTGFIALANMYEAAIKDDQHEAMRHDLDKMSLAARLYNLNLGKKD